MNSRFNEIAANNKGRLCKIRPATQDDLGRLVEIENAAFDPVLYRGALLTRRLFAYGLTQGNSMLLVAERGKTLAGYVYLLFRSTSDSARLYSIAVDPHHQGQGIGDSLFTAIELELRKKGLAGVSLEARSDNRKALIFYEKRGYKRVGEIPDYYPGHVPAVRMYRTIVPPTE